MEDGMVEFTKETLEDAEEKIEETFKAALGTLAEEASSELVRQELEAMQHAAVEMAGRIQDEGIQPGRFPGRDRR
jgi:hypothetical protein